MTAILTIVFFVMLSAVFNVMAGMPMSFWAVLFFVSLFVGVVAFYLTKTAVGATVVYSALLPLTITLVLIYITSGGLSLTVEAIGQLIIITLVTGALSSMLGVKLTGATRGGVLSAFYERRRVVRRS